MIRARTAWFLAIGLALVLGGALRADDIVELTVTGEGINKDSAKRDALRKALEEGGKVELSSHSQTENFVLVRDTIYSRAEGIVKDYKVLDEGEGAGGIFYCKIRARVDKNAVATEWGAVQNVLDQIGRPKVMVIIDEKIDNHTDDSSILESKIEERLIESGFDVYDRKQMDAIRAKEAADAAAEDNIAKVQALAKDFGTQIFVMGNSAANAAENKEVHGVALIMYNCNVQAKVFYTDTGKLISSKSLPNVRGGAQGERAFSPQAGKMAIANAAAPLIDDTYATVMKSWATQISAGAELLVEVEGISAGDAIKLKKALAEVPGVEKVNSDFTKGIAKYRVVAKMTAEELVEKLSDGELKKLVDVVDYKLNRIQAKKAGS
ncbi:MAG TPA: hypothetical protein VGM03_12875 [Phycisphaerae bacterium]|jgi:copper chaperone CopZ